VGDIKVILLNDDDPLPPDVIVAPDVEEMEPEAAVRYLMTEWGMGEVDARFHLAIIRGEIDGDTHAIDDYGRRIRSPRPDRTTA
jgi:hypothetical protein